MLVGVGGVSVTSAERGMVRKRRKYTGENEREISQKTSEPGRPQKWGGVQMWTHSSLLCHKKDVFSRLSPPTKEASEPPSHCDQTYASQ